MQKLISSLLVSSISASDVKIHSNELFLNRHPIEDKMQVEAVNIDTNSIAPCQYFTDTAIFNTQGIIKGDINDVQQTMEYTSPETKGKKYNWNFCE